MTCYNICTPFILIIIIIIIIIIITTIIINIKLILRIYNTNIFICAEQTIRIKSISQLKAICINKSIKKLS